MSTLKILFILILVFCVGGTSFALRASRPPILTAPITEDQISQLNRHLENMWNVQSGRFESDVTTIPKTNAKDGELWFIETGTTTRIQIKSNNTVFTFTPDNYGIAQ